MPAPFPIRPPDPFAAAHIGILLREQGRSTEAEDVFLDLIRRHPDSVFGWQELGILYARNGKPRKALHLFRRAIKAAPHDIQPRTHCAIHLLTLGRPIEADQVLAAHRQTSVMEQSRIRSLREFLDYLQRWPIARALTLTHDIEHGGNAMSVADVKSRIIDAIEGQTPFSLIRLGDGEGAWITLDEQDERAYAALYAENREGILRVWYGDDGLIANAAFRAVAAGLKEAVASADILGIPLSPRIGGEYELRSLRGFSCNLNILRWLESEGLSIAERYCSQDIHFQLQYDGFYPRVFQAASKVGVITCHRELKELIAQRTGAAVVSVHIVPEEKGFAHILGHNGIAEPHFPTVFDSVMADLRGRPQTGMLWVVAAGFLGKFYCSEIRRQGGCALDLGSIVDGWLGKITRPTLADDEEFVL